MSDAPTPSRAQPVAMAAAHPRGHVLYPNHYTWYILVSALDLVMTNTVMHHFGAKEVNSIARSAIEHFGFWGLIGLKFFTVIVVVSICEHIGRKRPALGKKIASWAVAVSAIPVVVALIQIVQHRL